MSKRRKVRQTFHLVDDQTGQTISALVLAQSKGGKFMKVWQDTGWDKRVMELRGESLKVLLALVHRADFNNRVPSSTILALEIGLRQPHVSRAYSELIKEGFLIKLDRTHVLSPYFCWKGRDEQYEQACRRLTDARPAIMDRGANF